MKKITNWLATWIATFTFVMAPVAQGAEAQKISSAQLRSALEQAGLNRQITVGEFYARNKNLFPEKVRKEVEPLILTLKNQRMPEIEMVTSKASNGMDIPTLRFSQNRQLLNIQWFGEQEKFVKFQNTNLSALDIVNFNDMFTRILAGDENIRKLATPKATSSQKTTFTYPAVTAQTWKKMTQKERASYIINMRLMWNDARRVLTETEKLGKKRKKTSANENFLQKWENFISLLNQDAEAADPKVKRKGKPNESQMADSQARRPLSPVRPGYVGPVAQNAGSSAYSSGSNCLVAGYTSKYSNRSCGVSNIYDSYKDESGNVDALVKSTNISCGAGRIACNPYVYGTPNGQAICISTSDPSFQIATHYDGPCDSQSRLGSNITFLKDENLRNADRYGADNRLLSDEELAAKYEEEQKANPKMVEDFINGLIAYNTSKKINFKEPLTEASLKAIVDIKKAFDKDINNARASCEAATANKNNETNFWGACDQLHRRTLSIAKFLETSPGCPSKGGIDPESLMCKCTNGTDVLPGATCGPGSVTPAPAAGQQCPTGMTDRSEGNEIFCTCTNGDQGKPALADALKTFKDKGIIGLCPTGGATLTPAQPGKPPAGETKLDCESRFPGATGLNAQCKCANDAYPDSITSDATGASAFSCKPGKPAKDVKNDDDCGAICKIGKFASSTFGVLALTGLAVFALYKIMLPKKPKVLSAADQCANGVASLCTQQCPVPQALLNGVCGCAACPPGQTISNASACTCSTTSTTTGTTLICWDNVTQVDDLSKCPQQTFPCWDGSYVTNALNCPEKPAGTKAAPTKVGK
jgi:hypothetical protein